MYQEIKERVSKFKGEDILLNDDDHEIFKEIPDAHAVAITASETAIPISSLRSTSYELQHGKTQIQHAPLDRYTKAIEAVILYYHEFHLNAIDVDNALDAPVYTILRHHAIV